jgi:TetR/AcrR family transcriptional regulator, tetracycline repressor protein
MRNRKYSVHLPRRAYEQGADVQVSLSRDMFINTALAVADEEGLESVTIRRLADIHSVTPMALYRYFADKERIFDALAARLLENVVVPQPDERPWHEQVMDLLVAFIAGVREHPNAAILVLGRILESDAGLTVTERMLELLSDGGFAVDAAAETASQALCSLVTLVITEPGRGQGGDVDAQDAATRMKRATLLSLDPRHYSHVVDAAYALAQCASEEVYYDRGLRMIVAGIQGTQTVLSGKSRRPSKVKGTKAAARRPAGGAKVASASKVSAVAKPAAITKKRAAAVSSGTDTAKSAPAKKMSAAAKSSSAAAKPAAGRRRSQSTRLR